MKPKAMSLTGAAACVSFVSLMVAATASAQGKLPPGAGAGGVDPIGPVVPNAPYSAVATSTVTQTYGDGTKINRTVVARLYRDSAGRIRREQSIMGLEPLDPSKVAPMIVTLVDPVAGVIYAMNPVTHTAHRLPFDQRAQAKPGIPPPPPPPPLGNGAVESTNPATAGLPPPPPPPPNEESLGTRQIEGVTATGKRNTQTIAAGAIGNDRPIVTTDERWESPELKLLLRSRHEDPRTGLIEFRLTKLQRTEPDPELFKVPPDYTIIDTSRPPQPEQAQDQPQLP